MDDITRHISVFKHMNTVIPMAILLIEDDDDRMLLRTVFHLRLSDFSQLQVQFLLTTANGNLFSTNSCLNQPP